MKALIFLIASISASAQVTPECTYTVAHSRPGALAVFRNGNVLQPTDYTRTGTLGRTITLNGWNDQDKITYSYPYAATTVLPGTSPPSTILLWIPTLEYHTCTGTQNPPPTPVAITRQQCVGTTPTSDCSGIELWTVNDGNGINRYYTVIPATSQATAIPPCPTSDGSPCYKPAALTDAPLAQNLNTPDQEVLTADWVSTEVDAITYVPTPILPSAAAAIVPPVMQDTTALTKQIVADAAPCGTDDAGCAAGFSAVLSMIATNPGPSNCSVSADYVSCTCPLVQDSNQTWFVTACNLSPIANSIWSATATPANLDSGYYGPGTFGLQFATALPGSVTAIRFYKSPVSAGQSHTAILYDNQGNVLAQAEFANETPTGWQEVTLPTPVPLTPDATYTAAYFTPTGEVRDAYFFAGTAVNNYPLSAFDGVSNGATAPAFPSTTTSDSNYWVDVVFSADPTI